MPLREILMRRTHLLSSVTIAFLLTAGACATAGTTGSGQKSSSTRITKSDINATSAGTAYDVVNQLHPEWLRPPQSAITGVLSTSQSGSGTGLRTPVVMVYLDGVRLGGIDQLRTLTAASVMSIEYADSNRVATVVRDSSTPDAAIMVSTKQ